MIRVRSGSRQRAPTSSQGRLLLTGVGVGMDGHRKVSEATQPKEEGAASGLFSQEENVKRVLWRSG